MIALHNFLISWVLMLFIALTATVRIIIAPLFFILARGEYKQSTADRSNEVVDSLKAFADVTGDYFKRYWRE